MNPKNARSPQRRLALLMLLTMLLSACQGTARPFGLTAGPANAAAAQPAVPLSTAPPARPASAPSAAYPQPARTPTPTPPPTRPATPMSIPLPTAVAPTAAPAGSPTPVDLANLPMPAPRLLYFSPSWGEEQLLDAPILLTFDQPMDHPSTEAAFTISPTVAGTFTWVGDHSLAFTPQEPLVRNKTYRVEVAATAKNAAGEPLEEGACLEFHTVGFLRVDEVHPPSGAGELDPDTVITVVFNRPVVALTNVGSGQDLPQPLVLDPPVPGYGEWLNTAIYVFYPEAGLWPATRYTATIAAGLEDTLGGILEQEYRWTFTTMRPAVSSYTPASMAPCIYLEQVISVTFNQPMDHTSAQEHFALRIGERMVSGRFRWSGGETPTSPETMGFVPTAPLARQTHYVATMSAGARPRRGTMALSQTASWSFTTLAQPGLVSIAAEKEGAVKVVYASPMQVDGFLEQVTITPPPAGPISVHWSDYDRIAWLHLATEPATAYTLTISAEAPDHYGVPVGTAAHRRWTTPPATAYAYLNTSGLTGVFSAYTDTAAYAAYRNVSRLDLSLHRLAPEEYMTLLGYSDRYSRPISNYVPKPENLVKTWTMVVEPPPNEDMLTRVVLSDAQGERLPPGLYLLKLTAPGVNTPSYFLFSRSQINLTLKQGPHETLVWATDLATGRPVANLAVRLHVTGTTPAASGTTDAAGLYRNDTIGWAGTERYYYTTFVVSGQPGQEDFCLVFDDWNGGIQAYDFDVTTEYNTTGYRGYLYTERPIYRPGQTVYFKGIVRYGDDAHYTIPSLEGVTVEIRDPHWKTVYNQRLTLSDMGTFDGELVLSEEAALGRYYLSIEEQDWDWYAYTGTSFRVAEYKKPEYQLEVAPARPAYSAGDTIDVSTLASYYFGGPVTDAAVHWSVLSQDYTFRYQCPEGVKCPWYSWSDYDPWYSRWDYWSAYEGKQYNPYGRLIAEGDTQTDNQGRTTYQVAADISQETQSQILTIESTVTDISGQEVSSRATAIVHRGDFYIGVAPRGYVVRAGKEKQVDLLAVDWDSRPVANVSLTVALLERRWYSVRRQEEDGRYYWTWSVDEIPVLTQTVSTDMDGRATATWVAESSGMYRVRALGRDARGNDIRSSAYFWVWGGKKENYWRRESTNRIDLVADRRSYEVGDTAEVLIPSPYSDTVYALVTIERGHVLETSVRQIAGNGEALRIPIEDAYVPNVYVSVVLMQGSAAAPDGIASFKMGLVNLPVSNKAKELNIQVTPDRDMALGLHYAPRQTATYDILVTDVDGNPVEAELSLRLADLAVLALANESAPPLLERYWYARGLSIRTSMPLVVAMEAYNREIQPGQKGGGGGDGDGVEEGFVRTRFADTAYWAPAVRTGADGRAQVTVELPDNLTTWRMQAIGVTADTLVGRADVDVLTTLDVLVRSVLPRFFVAGDRARIGTIVHNNTNAAQETRVELGVAGLVLEGPAVVTVTIPPHDKARVDWPVSVPGGEQVQVTMTARAGGQMDGRADTLPVYRYATPDVVATAGRLGQPGLRQELIQIPPVGQSPEGELRVQIEGSLTAASRDALRYLEHYPYECVEQTTSRFMPNVHAYATLKEMGLSNPNLEENLTRLVGVGLQRLYNFQHYDGGWGWWQNDENNLYLTAYVLQGMLEAHRAGFAVDEGVIHKGATYLRGHLPAVSSLSSHWMANRMAYALYVLAEYRSTFEPGQLQSLQSLAVGLYERRHLLDDYAQATLAVALGLIEPQEPSRVETLLADLRGRAVTSAAGAHWAERRADYWNMNTDVRSTAIVIWALSRLKPESEVLPGAVRWLMSVRQEGYWQTTNTTAWSLMALVAYMRASGEMQGDYDYQVYLNGDVLGGGQVNQENLAEPATMRIEITRLLVEETNRLIIQRLPAQEGQTGLGQLYYSVYLRYYVPVEQVRALDRGIIVARSYSLVDRPEVPVQSARVGDLVRVKVTIIAPNNLHYVVVEDPLPAGCEGVDASLLTTSVVGERPALQNATIAERNRWYWRHGWGWWWFSRTEMRDEKVVLFAGYLREGTYEYTYMMRASVPGEFQVMPSFAYQMYFPEVFGRSDGEMFVVTSEE